MKKYYFYTVLIICFALLFSGCFKKEVEHKNTAVFNYSGMLADGKQISLEISIDFNSKTDLKTGQMRKNKLNHALNMTMHIYSYNQLKGSKLKILLRDVLTQVFMESFNSFTINTFSIE